MGKIKKAEPVGPTRPRERSPRRGDRRPIEVQRREEAKNRRGGGVLFPGGDGREEAMAMRSKTIPKEEPKKGKTPEYYIGDQGETQECAQQVRHGREWPKRHAEPGARQQHKAHRP